jgi:cytidylate kinase
MAILTTSRQLGSGNTDVQQAIVSWLGYQSIDKQKLLDEIRPLGRNWERWAEELDRTCPSIWEKYDWSFKGFGALVQSILLNYALKDNVCLTGRGANFLLEDIPNAFRIRIVAPMEQRIERILARESVSEETAQWMAEKADQDSAGFIQALYGKNMNDPKYYDVIFDSGVKSVDEIASEVKEALLARDSLKTECSQNVLKMRAFAATIKAAIFTEPRLYIPTLDVESSGPELVLRGIVHNPKQHQLIEETVRKISGEVPVRCELRHRW